MDPDQQVRYLELAAANPYWLCSDIPIELLEECSYVGDEPTPFLNAFFAAGHGQWLYRTHGIPPSAVDPERMQRAALLLWIRACELYTSRLYQRPGPDWDQAFFSDEGLY